MINCMFFLNAPITTNQNHLASLRSRQPIAMIILVTKYPYMEHALFNNTTFQRHVVILMI